MKMRAGIMPRSRDLSKAAEHQMRTWALRIEAAQRLEEESQRSTPEQLIKPYIAISRESGVDATDIAQKVASQLGWKIFDRELLDYMVEHHHWSRVALDYVDERTVSWFHETFGKWLDSRIVSQAEYVSRLGKVILLAAQHESTVFVGRGAQFILPSQVGLTVRIIGPQEYKVKRIMERRQCSKREAEAFMTQTETGRNEFVQRYFHHDVTSPQFYDIIVNLEQFSRSDVVELIVTCQRLIARHVSA
jgi:cytidylate kinase